MFSWNLGSQVWKHKLNHDETISSIQLHNCCGHGHRLKGKVGSECGYLQIEGGMHIFRVGWPSLLSEDCGFAELQISDSCTSYQYMWWDMCQRNTKACLFGCFILHDTNQFFISDVQTENMRVNMVRAKEAVNITMQHADVSSVLYQIHGGAHPLWIRGITTKNLLFSMPNLQQLLKLFMHDGRSQSTSQSSMKDLVPTFNMQTYISVGCSIMIFWNLQWAVSE